MAIRALVLGFGGTGTHILTYVKEQVALKYGARAGRVRFLLFDTIKDWKPGQTVKIAGGAGEETIAKGTEISLDPNSEYYFLEDHDPDLRQYVDHLLTPAGRPELHPQLKDWLHTPWLRDNVERAQMEIVVGAAQQRQIGRFAIFQNAQRVVDQIAREVRHLTAQNQQEPVNVWLVGSSAGGTGAGCLLDAAHLTRLAVGDHPVSLTGVIVLPEVYAEKDGISPGRAYSLFRELDRFQRQGITDRDRYLLGDRLTASTVLYDPHGLLRSKVAGKLFDNLFFVGSACRSDAARTAFFTSVANAIDPFLDTNAGPPLLEKSVNQDAAASAFGAARVYVPKESLGELFAWRQVDRYLRSATAYVEQAGRRGIASGSGQERDQDARRKVQGLSPLFGRILELEGTDETLARFARTLRAPEIVEEWYGTAAPQVIGLDLRPDEAQILRLAYAAPAYSWKESEPQNVPTADRNVKTRSEYRAAARALRLPAESAAESCARFARELEEVMRAYKDPEASDRSFEKGRRMLFAKLSDHLRTKVDRMVREAIEQSTRFGVDDAAPDQGTALTRLYQELRQMLADRGPFHQIERRVEIFIQALESEEEVREHEAVQATQELREWKPRFGLFGGSIEGLLIAARESVSSYFTVYQRDRLLVDLQSLVRTVRGRVEEWERLIRSTLSGLVEDPSESSRAESAGHVRRLENRLARLAKNPNARISLDPDWSEARPGEDMLGYRDELESLSTVDRDGAPLAAALLRSSTWRLDVDGRGRPDLGLTVELDSGAKTFDRRELGGLHGWLYDRFREHIDRQIAATDIFDYLVWVERRAQIGAADIARVLLEAARPLINAVGRETFHLVVRTPGDRDKERWIDSLSQALAGNGVVERVPHSDRDSITVFRILKPQTLDSFINVVDCRNDYVARQCEMPNPAALGRFRELKRAQVYHAFRPELEAWFIERRVQQLGQVAPNNLHHLSPRLVALLEDPAMMQVFVECVATGAVEKTSDGDWVWHRGDEDIPLTVDAPDADLIRAAVVFVLQRREGQARGLRPIELEAARQSARACAQRRGTTVADACQTFLHAGLAPLLRALRPSEHGEIEREREGLRILFEFYGDRTTRTDLERRTELVHAAS